LGELLVFFCSDGDGDDIGVVECRSEKWRANKKNAQALKNQNHLAFSSQLILLLASLSQTFLLQCDTEHTLFWGTSADHTHGRPRRCRSPVRGGSSIVGAIDFDAATDDDGDDARIADR
jgi:hypothetical protein